MRKKGTGTPDALRVLQRRTSQAPRLTQRQTLQGFHTSLQHLLFLIKRVLWITEGP